MLNMTPYRKHNEYYDPFRELAEFERSLFAPESTAGLMRTDIEDKGDHLELKVDLPGFKKEDIHLDLENDRLAITAERHSNYEDKEKKNGFLCCERSYGSYRRNFNLEGIDVGGIEAAYNDGVLMLTLPKLQPKKPEPKRLEIK